MFQSDMMAQDFKRTVARLQMDNDKLEKDLDNFAEKERQYLHQIKETEDRVSLSKRVIVGFLTHSENLIANHLSKMLEKNFRRIQTMVNGKLSS